MIDRIAAICRREFGQEPILIPRQIPAWTKPRWCHGNAWEQIRRNGGEQMTGYQFVTAFGGRVLILYFHSVWKSPTGELLDITPNDPKLMERNEARPIDHRENHCIVIEGKALFLPVPGNVPLLDRIFALVKDKEIKRIVSFIQANNADNYRKDLDFQREQERGAIGKEWKMSEWLPWYVKRYRSMPSDCFLGDVDTTLVDRLTKAFLAGRILDFTDLAA